MAYRKEKIERQIQRLVSDLIIKEIKDPRIGFATITRVELNRDFTEAKVGVSVFGSPRELRKTLEGLKSATGFIQHRVGKSLGIRHIPKIIFFLDSSLADGSKMVDLLDELEESESHEEDEPREDGEE